MLAMLDKTGREKNEGENVEGLKTAPSCLWGKWKCKYRDVGSTGLGNKMH